MTPSCRAAREGFSRYAVERLPADERAVLRSHLRDCADCSAHAAGLDPTMLFVALPGQETSKQEIALVLEGVRAAIAWKDAERRLAPPPRRAGRWASAAAIAALTLALPAGLRVSRAPVAPAARAAAEDVARDSGFALTGGPQRSQDGAGEATVYDWNPGDGQPRVVWIVDRSLDI